VDRFTAVAVAAALRPCLDPAARIVHPFGPERVSFMRLARAAGLGVPSRLGVLIHPVFGPWIAFRAAVLVPEVVSAPRPADQFDPCPGCAQPACMAACPGRAVGPGGWDVGACAATRADADDPCAGGCHARLACVVGPEHRYPEAALEHHQAHARPMLLRAVRS
jgi:epoxyqueuosine reductase